jgi:hypothetical protein
MTDENVLETKTWCPPTATDKKYLLWDGRSFRLVSAPYNQCSVIVNGVADPYFDINSKLDDEIRKFEFRRRLEKIQFQVREEFKSEAAELARELRRSEPLANALSQPGPCDGDLHSKIMPWRQA